MELKRLSTRINSYLASIPKHLGDVLRLFVVLCLFVSTACTGGSTTINNQSGPNSQANPDTRTSDPDGWGGGSTGDGGGGQGVMCSDETKDTNLRGKLVVRDVYEAQYNYRRTMVSEGLGASGTEKVDDKTILFLVQALQRYFGPSMSNLEIGKAQYWKDFAAKISFVPDDAALYPSNDANSALALPKGCHIVQIAYWDETSGVNDSGTLYVDKKSWKNLDQFNKAALLAHEYFFKQARLAGFKNSDYTRYKVGQLLSSEGMPALFPKWQPSIDSRVMNDLPKSAQGFKYCVGNSEEPGAALKYYQYQDSAGQQTVVIPELKTARYHLPPFQSINFSFGANSDEYMRLGRITNSFYSRNSYGLDFSKSNLGPGGLDVIGLGGLGLEDSPFVYYSAPFKAGPGNGKISFLNPLAGKALSESAEMKPRDELVALLNKAIEGVIESPLSMYRYDEGFILGPISVLNMEIDEAIRSGIYPTGFKKWSEQLNKIENTKFKSYSPVSAEPRTYSVVFEKREKELLYKTLPETLYRIKSGTYNAKEVFGALGLQGFKQTLSKVDNQLAVTVDGSSVEFKLDCQSYSEIYRQITEEPVLDVSQISLKTPVVVEINRPDIKKDDKSWTAIQNDFLKSISAILSSGRLGDERVRSNFLAMADDVCFTADGKSDADCLTVQQFLSDLVREKFVRMNSCTGVVDYPTSLAPNSGLRGVCVIFEFPKAKQSYAAIFQFMNIREKADYERVSSNTRNKMDVDDVHPLFPFLDKLERIPSY